MPFCGSAKSVVSLNDLCIGTGRRNMRRMRLDAYLEQLKRKTGATKADFAREADLHPTVITRLCQDALGTGETWAKVMRATKGQVTPLDHYPAKKGRKS
jgi:hypothetical protein